LSTLALDGSSRVGGSGRLPAALRYADLALLALALPLFIVAEWPLLGYAVAGGAWLAARAIGLVADRRVLRDLAGGERRHALGVMALAMLGRVWLLALAVLLVGLAEREAGLAAALLAAALFTVYLGGRGLAGLFEPEASR
jgi:putative exporter of polyketide antibiotics